mmetsp:Transcript_46134/g.130885  ORF Transcript_46134/g.130885 Transcript_46134/m.130885 type:complete len:181 (-) Transcript_46134:114-656(-)
MALVTGGLGGLGVIATYELAAGGAPYVVTTSRSGRIAGGQRELVALKEQLQQMTPNYSARVDGADMAALSDLFQWIQAPESFCEDLDVFSACIGSLERSPHLMGPDEVAKLQMVRDHIRETCDLLEKEVSAGRGTSREEWLLRETRKKQQKLDEMLNKVGQIAPAREQVAVLPSASSNSR